MAKLQMAFYIMTALVCLCFLKQFNMTTQRSFHQSKIKVVSNKIYRGVSDAGITSPCKALPKNIYFYQKPKFANPVCCGTCSLVISSGILTGSNAGTEIDASDCVIRMNDAPTHGYEKDVGSKTTIRIAGHDGLQRVFSHQKKNNTRWATGIYVKQSPYGVYLDPDLIRLGWYFPNSTIMYFGRERMKDDRDVLISATSHIKSDKSGVVSTGFHTILFAKDLCDSVDVFGLVDREYCDKVDNDTAKDVRYHYYEDKPMQCDHYKYKNASKGDMFFSEKLAYREFVRREGSLRFYHPTWPMS